MPQPVPTSRARATGVRSGNLRQSQRCLPDTQHVIFAQHPGSLMRPQIGGHPQLGAIISRMRAQVKHGAVLRFFAGVLGGAGIF